MTFRQRGSLAAAIGAAAAPRSGRRSFAEAFTVGASNPKAIVFFAAVLPQFASRAAGHVPLQMLALGGIFCGIALISDSMWAVAAATARSWFTRSPRRLEMIGGASGLAMIGIGATLALSGGRD